MLKKESHKNGIFRITLCDVSNRNALSNIMMKELAKVIDASNTDDSIKVIIIAAEGDVFCSGHNLKEINSARDHDDGGKSFFDELFKSCSFLMQLIVNCKKPVIAEVNGVATAAGCQLVASCDLAISSEKSKFATPGVDIGLFCSTPMVALSRNVHKKNAMKMLLTGEMIDAKEAKRISLINDYVSEDELKESVLDLAKKISMKSSKIIKLGKEGFYKQLNMNLLDAYEYTSSIMTENTLENDAIEGINAFLEKREANWDENNE